MARNKTDFLVPIKSYYGKPMAPKPVSVVLPVDIDEFVRSLPNRAEWLREAVAEKYDRETKQNPPKL